MPFPAHADIIRIMFVKICGLKTDADVAAAVSAGADAVGFVLTESVRRVNAATAKALAAPVSSSVLTVAVVSGIPASEAARLATEAGLGAVQLHGDYPPEAFAELSALPVRVVRATSLTTGTDVRAGAYGEDMLLLDAPSPGSGKRWDLAPLGVRGPQGRWLLAGGLDPGNVAQAIATARPWGVDVSSGVESTRGVKDHDLIRAFVSAARAQTA